MIGIGIGTHRRIMVSGAAFANEKSLLFDGVDEFTDITDVLTNSLSTTTRGTWSCWVNPVSATPNDFRHIMSFGDTNVGSFLALRQNNVDGLLHFRAAISGGLQWRLITDNVAFSDNVWTNVVITQNGTEPKIHIDSVFVDQAFNVEINKAFWFNNLPLLDNGRIGSVDQNSAGNIQFWNGNIDEVGFWDTDITTDQIIELYNNGVPTDLLTHSANANLVSWFRMGDKATFAGGNFTFPDQKGSNNATSVNMEEADVVEDVPS